MNLRVLISMFVLPLVVTGTSYAAAEPQWISASQARGATAAEKKAEQAPEGTSRFARTVTNAKTLVGATYTASGLGVFELYVNGVKVGDDVLKPGFTHGQKTKYAFTYDVTALVTKAAAATNVFAARVSTGWWNDKVADYVGEKSALWARIVLTYADGTTEIVVSDLSWCADIDDPVRRAGIFDGEFYDARAEGRPLAATPAVVNTEFTGEILPQRGANVVFREDLTLTPVAAYTWAGVTGATSNEYGTVKKMRTWTAAELKDAQNLTLGKGETLVVDFGQNAAAVPAFTASAPEGTVLTILPAEMLNDGNGAKSRGCVGPEGSVYRANLREARRHGTRVVYTFGATTPATYRPTFTFFGYRYASLTATETVTFTSLKSVPVTSIRKEMELGTITTGRADVNRLIANVKWGQYSNYLSVPTDCPQRDERQGWTADTQVFAKAGSFNAATYDFFVKYLRDLRDTQVACGSYTGVAPIGVYGFGGQQHFGWADCGVIVPYVMWRQTGRTDMLAEHWASMTTFMNWLKDNRYAKDKALNFQWADWLSCEDYESWSGNCYLKDGKDRRLVRPEARLYWKYLGGCYWLMDARMMAEMAAALGKADEAASYRAMAETALAYLRDEVMEAGRIPACLRHLQTPALFALHCGLLSDPMEIAATKAALLKNIKDHGDCLQTGFLGTSILMDTLTYDVGAPEVAYTLLLQHKNASWLYSVDQGATTIWERWDGYTKEKGFGPDWMNSFNHYAYGAVLAWIYETAAGIQAGPEPGWDDFVLAPIPDARLGSINASYRTAKGDIRSAWTYEDGVCRWTYTVPEGATATVRTPSGEKRRTAGTYTETLAHDVWSAKWIGPDPKSRPDRDWGKAQWIAVPSCTNEVVVLKTTLVCGELPTDAVAEIVHAGDVERELFVNGRLCYRREGHLADARRPVAQNIAAWLKPGSNALEVRLKGKGGRMFLAKVSGVAQSETGPTWTSDAGAVSLLGTVRETPLGESLIFRTETESPAFARRFAVGKDLVRATLRISGVGFYEAYLNGVKVGDAVLEPSPTNYDKTVLYATHDVTPLLQAGEDELTILLGHGWYDNRALATWNFDIAPWRDFPRTIAQLDLVYADGRRETVATDSSWSQVTNPVVYDDLYEGEVLDGRVKMAVRPTDGRMAREVAGPCGRLMPAQHPSARVKEEIAPSSVTDLGGGDYLVAFPVNLSGWIRMKLFGQSAGDVVSFRYDERVNPDFTPMAESVRDGFHDAGLGLYDGRRIDIHFRYPASYPFCAKDAAFQCDRYICRGEDGETFEPRFSYKGFRYVLVRGLKRAPRPRDVVGCFVHTDFPTIGDFSCSDETFNTLMEMGVRSYKCNFTDGVPTDCPHREKNGWTGDASIASEFAQYVFENTTAYEKWLRDILDAQRPDGDIPAIVPTSGWGFAWGNGPAWDSALPVIAWNLWIYREDRRILEEVYPALKKYLALTATRADAEGLVSHGLGDWIPVTKAHMPSVRYTSSCYYYQAQRIASEMAKVLGLADEAADLAAAAAKTRSGLRRNFAKDNDVWDNGGQTAQGMALAFGLVEEEELPAVAARLVDAVETADRHVDMGLLGTKHVFRALSRIGRTDLAWQMLTNPTSPSPVDWIRKGGTTLWEDWGDGASRNHVMFGDFVGWAYQYLAGIRMAETDGSTSAVTVPVEPGFKRVVIEPVFLKNLNHLSASTQTSRGRLSVSWQRQSDTVKLLVTVPRETVAEIRVPGRAPLVRGEGVWLVETCIY